MMDDMTRIAVTGARGRLGGQVAELLARQEGVEVVGLTRAVADYDDRSALTAALAGVDRLVLVSSDGEAEPNGCSSTTSTWPTRPPRAGSATWSR